MDCKAPEEFNSAIRLEVLICSGKGLGKGFVDSLKPDDPINTLLGTTVLYPGTLFVKLKKPINLKGLGYPTSGNVTARVLRGYLQNREVVIKWTKKYPRNLQLISSFHLRSELKLTDGDYSEIFFMCDDILNNNFEIYWNSSLQWLKGTKLAKFRRATLRKIRDREIT